MRSAPKSRAAVFPYDPGGKVRDDDAAVAHGVGEMHGDIHELRERMENIAAINGTVLTAKATHLLDRLLEEWASYGVERLFETR